MTIPAKDAKGNPMLAVLLNFGDERIVCGTNVPSASVAELQTATLEVKVFRQLVANWDDTQNALNFLVLMLPELRSGQVIASWSLKYYSQDRQVVSHGKAQYLHGFLKIPMEHLECTLRRSGTAGVFIQCKGDNHRPDPQFGIVPLPGQTLEEAQSLANKIDQVLGIVTMGSQDAYALRARREYIHIIKKQALPQSLSMQEGIIPPGSTWFYLKSV